jgi:hypothetical protein
MQIRREMKGVRKQNDCCDWSSHCVSLHRLHVRKVEFTITQNHAFPLLLLLPTFLDSKSFLSIAPSLSSLPPFPDCSLPFLNFPQNFHIFLFCEVISHRLDAFCLLLASSSILSLRPQLPLFTSIAILPSTCTHTFLTAQSIRPGPPQSG